VTEINPPTADRSAQLSPAAGATGARRWQRPPIWLWGVSVVLQVVCAAALTGFTFFLVDDYEFMSQAQAQSFSLAYLRRGLYEHFSPVSRALDKLLVVLAPGNFVLAHGIELALYAAALVVFAMVMRTILGNGWIAFAFTLVFGQSVFLIRLLYWWTATANILPSTIFMLFALWCYLRWRESGSRTLLVGSFVAYALALLDYETATLFPAYLAVISLLVLERHPGPRTWLASLWRERRVWAGYVALDAAALVNYYRFYYSPAVRPSFSELVHYLAIALFQTFVQALVGVKYSQAPAVCVVAGIVVLTAIAVTLYLRPRAWRCLAAFILVFLITMLPVGLTKVARFGVTVGQAIYYQQSVQFMFLVLAAFAIGSRWSGRRAAPAFRTLRPAAGRWRALVTWRPSRGALTAAGITVVAAYAALYVTSLQAMDYQVRQSGRDRAYVTEYLASDKQVRAAIGREPVLIDLDVPGRELPRHFGPVPSYGVFLALFNPHLHVDEIAKPVYVLSPRGRLLPVRFVASTRGLLARARVTAANHSAGVAAAPRGGSSACVPAGRSASWLEVPLARAQRMNSQPNGLAYAIRVHFRMPTGSTVSVRLIARGGRGFAIVSHEWGRGSGGQLIPLDFTGRLHELEFLLPARACVTGLTFGRLRYTHNSRR
jgi:hypothetical protein